MNKWVKAGLYVVTGFTAVIIGGFSGVILSLKYLLLFI